MDRLHLQHTMLSTPDCKGCRVASARTGFTCSTPGQQQQQQPCTKPPMRCPGKKEKPVQCPAGWRPEHISPRTNSPESRAAGQPLQ
eukprot:555972-Pelagomonas_calceolata.AAC.4